CELVRGPVGSGEGSMLTGEPFLYQASHRKSSCDQLAPRYPPLGWPPPKALHARRQSGGDFATYSLISARGDSGRWLLCRTTHCVSALLRAAKQGIASPARTSRGKLGPCPSSSYLIAQPFIPRVHSFGKAVRSAMLPPTPFSSSTLAGFTSNRWLSS